MKKSIIAIALLLTGAAGLQAVGDLQISLQGTNVVLSWASTNSDYYLVQYSTNLSASHPWQTLTNWMPGSDGTNTVFVHSGAFQIPTASPSLLGYNDLLSAQTLGQEEISLAMRADDPNSAAPVFLYPPGFDFSGFLLYDPETQTWRSGNGFTRDNPPDPLIPGTNTNSTITVPVMYFYRVARNGVYLSGLTNGTTLSGTVSIPLEVVGVENETVAGVSLFDNGSLIKTINITSNSIPDHIDLDTRRLSNGVHNISAWIECISSDSNETNFVQFSSESSPVSVNSYNSIFYPDWLDEFGEIGNVLEIRIQSIYANKGVQIDIQDSRGTNVIHLEGITSDGSVGFVWPNLADLHNHLTNYVNDLYFSITVKFFENDRIMFDSTNDFSISESLKFRPEMIIPLPNIGVLRTRNYIDSVSKQLYRKIDPWFKNGNWVIVYQPAWYKESESELRLKSAISQHVQKAKNESLSVYPSGEEQNAFEIDFGGVQSLKQFREALYDLDMDTYDEKDLETRNFFYVGHAAAGQIGSGNNSIKVGEIEEFLATGLQSTNSHAYRFVFLYGCNTANGGLSQAFGITNAKVDLNCFRGMGLRPKAFVGWNYKHSMGNDIIKIDEDNIKFIREFSDKWNDTKSLEDVINEIGQGTNTTISSDFRSKVRKHLKIYGYYGLTYLGFNTPIIAP